MTLAAGARLGPYEVVSPIGAGGMGEVYRGRDPRLNREVAIKVLPSSLSSDPDRLRRFELEARAAGALNHPNIVSVYDVGFHDGTPYVVTELLEGETLRAELAGGKIPPRRAIDYALQISQGLAAAHEKGIVHRDLKPENLFITTHGRLKILDFGLAKLETSAASPGSSTQAPTMAAATEPGVVLGTLGYMSPEQVRGGSADVRSDIFAFGAILLEMLTGSRAFQRESAADTISAILKEEPPIPGDRRGGIPREMDRIIRHCLEKKPEQRFQSAHDLAFALSTAAGEFERSRGPRFGRTSFLTIAAVIAALGLAIVLLRARGGEARRPAGPASERKSIAVLPFQNLSPDPENAFFADGMTEDILTQLAKVGDLKVISRTSVMRYKGTQKPIKEIASELGVGTVLEGSVRRAGDRVRIAGQLVDARSDEHLWAETYDRELKDVFGIQSEVAQKIAAALRATLSSAEKKRIERPPTQNLAAYDLYLKGRDLYYHYRKADNESAIELFQNALGLDSGFALAYAGLGDGYAQRALRFGFPASWLTSSLEMGRKAVALDPELAEGHKAVALAHLVGSRYRESLDSGRRAIALNPNHATAIYNYGAVLRFLGRLDEALPWMKRAIELDPKNPILASGVGITYAALNEPAEAERWFQRSLELQPDLGQSHAYLIWLYMYQRRDREALEHARATVARLSQDPWTVNAAGTAELVVGDPARARELFDRILPIYKGTRGYRDYGPGIETHLAFLDVRAGRVSDANERLEESAATDRRLLESGSQDPSVPFDTACVHALRGQRDEAFRWLGKAVEAGWRDGPFGSRTPLLDSLKSDPRFQKLNSRIESLVKEMRRRAGLGQS